MSTDAAITPSSRDACAGRATATWNSKAYRQLDVHGAWGFTGAHLERYVHSLPAVVERHAIGELVTSFALEEANEAIAAVASGGVVKAVVSPTGAAERP